MSDNSQKCPAQVPLAQIGILNVLFCLYNSPKSKCIQFTTIKNNKNIFKLLIFKKKIRPYSSKEEKNTGEELHDSSSCDFFVGKISF